MIRLKQYSTGHYVFKCCNDAGNNHDEKSDNKNANEYEEYIVVMEKLDTAITNESRKDVSNPMCAKFRANCLLVVDIIPINDPFKPVNSISHIPDQRAKYVTTYSSGKIVTPHEFDNDLNKVCTSGIHYFKSPECAYYYRLRPSLYTGHWKSWSDDGSLSSETNYVRGKLSGRYRSWYAPHEIEFNRGALVSPQIKIDCEYLNGKKHGHWFSCYANGNIEKIGQFFNDVESGHWTQWFGNGQLASNGNYVIDKNKNTPSYCPIIFTYRNGKLEF
jgi:antitoxin component YwqK of YwqJK toxin-antitoxin module